MPSTTQTVHQARDLALATNVQAVATLAIAQLATGIQPVPSITAMLHHAQEGASSIVDLHSAESYRRDSLHATHLDNVQQ